MTSEQIIQMLRTFEGNDKAVKLAIKLNNINCMPGLEAWLNDRWIGKADIGICIFIVGTTLGLGEISDSFIQKIIDIKNPNSKE